MQQMNPTILGLDHVVVLVRDLSTARENFQRLGFTVSERGVHSPELGTANHTIMFQDNYLELLGIVEETPFNAPWRHILEQREGLVGIAVATSDATAARSAFSARSVEATPVREYSREVCHHGRTLGTASFASTHIDQGSTPGSILFACEHRTRELLWLPDLMTHTNGAERICAVSLVSDAPRQLAECYGRVLDASPAVTGDDAYTVQYGTGHLRFMTPELLSRDLPQSNASSLPSPAAAGITLQVSDLARARRILREDIVAGGAAGCRLDIAPEAACGVWIRIEGRISA